MTNKIMFETADWQRFVTMDMLTAEAGVSRDKIAKLVAKELADNACDVGNGTCIMDQMGEHGFYIQDFGAGIDLKDVAEIFSVRRPLKSTKYLRLPSRGALGNGLRVVVGAVLCTGGTLVVHTRGKVLNLTPQPDGYTKVEVVGDSEHTVGTRVEVTLGSEAGPINLIWASVVRLFSDTKIYDGKTSAHWYTAGDFYALCQRAGSATVDDLLQEFNGCSNAAGSFGGVQASSISPADAGIILAQMQAAKGPIDAKRLGSCNTEVIERVLGSHTLITGKFRESIPFVVEAWAAIAPATRITSTLQVVVNRTPITGEVHATSSSKSKSKLYIAGCNIGGHEGYGYNVKVGTRPVDIFVSILTPYMPITSSGKSPDLSPFAIAIIPAIEKAAAKAT